MSVCLLSCPLCINPHFKNVDELRNSLIDVATKTLRCPICDETVLGLDKLTIHLFVHTKCTDTKLLQDKSVDKLKKVTSDSERKVDVIHANKRSRPPCSKTKVHQPANTQIKLVNPKLPVISLNTVPMTGIAQNHIADTIYTNTLMCKETCIAENPTGSNSNTLSISQENAYYCDLCSLNFIDENILSMHKILIHNMEERKLVENITRFPCHLCNKQFKMKGSLMVHFRVAHYGIRESHFLYDKILQDGPDLTQKITNNSISSPEKEDLLLNDRADNKQWSCDTCHKSFTTKYFLKKHKRLHTGEMPYACTQCNKTFTFQQSYHKHLLYHNDEKPHTCNQCGRSFKELSTLHNHQRIHTGEKPFSCETCGKCFRQRVSYLVHRRIHTGVTPYKCTACDKSFRYKVSQRTHKCAAQPPGTIVRQTGDLVQKILQNKSHNETQITNAEIVKTVNVSLDLSSAKPNEDLIRSGAKLSLEDTEADNFSLMPEKEDSLLDGIVNESYVKMQLPTSFEETIFNNSSVLCDLNSFTNNSKDEEKSVPSPSEILKNLCISSYDEMIIGSDLNKTFSLI